MQFNTHLFARLCLFKMMQTRKNQNKTFETTQCHVSNNFKSSKKRFACEVNSSDDDDSLPPAAFSKPTDVDDADEDVKLPPAQPTKTCP